MKGSILRWTTAIAATAVLAVPAATFAQTPPATAPQPPAASATADTQPASPADHIRLAKAAIESIPADSLTAKPKAQVAALKRHLSSLERAAAAKDATAGAAATAATAGAAKAGASWATEVAAIDKILTELTGNASTSGSAAPTGTTGTAGAAAVALDPTTSAKLLEVRTHVTAFAAAMSGTAPAANTASPAPMTASPEAIAAANPTATSSAAPSATASAAPATGSQPPAPQPATPSTPDPAVAGTTPQTPTPDATVDQEAAAKHLTAARDSLTQLTELPAAAQLTGDARTQVQQLIANFNELITTKAEWRASYAKVDANLTALIGVERADESAATPPAATPATPPAATPPTSPPTGTEGAVGTAGTTTVSLDPALRAKLMEMRTHLLAFQKAAGGPGL